MVGEIEPDQGHIEKHPNLRVAYVAQHAFAHIEDHLDKTPVEYIMWRYRGGFDKEMVQKINKNRELFYSDELCFHWEFCKYFWEGHIELPQTNIETIENVLS